MCLQLFVSAAGVMHEASSAWLSYALALHQLHKADAKGQAQRALEQGMSASPAPQVVPQTPYEVLLHDSCSILLCLTSLAGSPLATPYL